MGKKVIMELTEEQAYAVRDALDLYTRIGIGQLEELGELARKGVIPLAAVSPSGQHGERKTVPHDTLSMLDETLNSAKVLLGYSINGSHGIGHPHVHMSAHRCYEVQKVLDKGLAVARNPNPEFRGVSYDGLFVRYTQDPAPIVLVSEPSPARSVFVVE